LFSLQKPVRRIERSSYEQEIDYYIDNGFVDQPESFFTSPAGTPEFSVTAREAYGDGERQLIKYNSEYAVRNPLVRDRYCAHAANRTGYLVRWTHGAGRKTVLCHHGYMLGEPRQAEEMFRVRQLFSMGLDVALFVAPFHWKRGDGSLRQRGIYLQPDDPAMTCECAGQAMHDLHGSFGILRDMGAADIGLIGASLGGYNAALFSGLFSIHSFAALMVPAVVFGGTMSPDRARLSFASDAKLREKARRVWDLHSPLNFTPKIPGEKILVVASRGDRLCPFDDVLRLCNSWRITNRTFLTGGHWLIFNRYERGGAWYRFLADRGFIQLL
jgi:hypothetical protein